MGLIGWIFYIFLGVLLFVLLQILKNKYDLSRIEEMIFSILLWLIVSGFCLRWGFKVTDNIFLVFVFLMIADVIYNSYFVERDFFDRSEGNVFYYIVLVLIGFFVNQEFINKVKEVFLTGEDLRILLWAFLILFLYYFCQNKNVFSRKKVVKNQYMSPESILRNYVKFKYQFYDECNYNDSDISHLLYAIMVFQNNKRSKILRNYDYFLFRLHGNKKKLGIMQVESKDYISDSESISLTYKKLEDIKKKSKKKLSVKEIIEQYDKKNAEEIQYIFEVLKKF